MKIYPNNTVAKYITKLASNIELDGEWEVALTEIMYTSKWANISGEWFRHCYDGIWGRKWPVPNDYYTWHTLVDKLAEMLRDTGEGLGHLKLDFCAKDRVSVVNSSAPLKGFELSPRLADAIGLQNYDITKCDDTYLFHGQTPEAIDDISVKNLFVYCDILEHVPVGDAMAPLLRCINVRGNQGDRICETFTSPMYLPVQKKVFDSVEINIMMETGEPAPFIDGPSTVILHFRRTSNPYFLSK
jgi:hypothetical protein